MHLHTSEQFSKGADNLEKVGDVSEQGEGRSGGVVMAGAAGDCEDHGVASGWAGNGGTRPSACESEAGKGEPDVAWEVSEGKGGVERVKWRPA